MKRTRIGQIHIHQAINVCVYVLYVRCWRAQLLMLNHHLAVWGIIIASGCRWERQRQVDDDGGGSSFANATLTITIVLWIVSNLDFCSTALCRSCVPNEPNRSIHLFVWRHMIRTLTLLNGKSIVTALTQYIWAYALALWSVVGLRWCSRKCENYKLCGNLL